ncbi:MAG: MgtC/SapB family protein [Alphaproteobacteria bacterium]
MWDWIAESWEIGLSPGAASARLCAALAFGAAIGFEREATHRAAGLRTHMLVSLASALFTIIAFEMYGRLRDSGVTSGADPLRLLEAVTAGVAYLAAGSNLRDSGGVRGLTTGAGLWLAGAVGMASGYGLYGLAAVSTVLAIVVLALLRLAKP